jgi:hypothetical protein
MDKNASTGESIHAPTPDHAKKPEVRIYQVRAGEGTWLGHFLELLEFEIIFDCSIGLLIQGARI